VNSAYTDSFRKFLKQDPLIFWRQISHPVLVLNGDKDSQVPAKENVLGIVQALKSTPAKVNQMILPNLNHMFQNAKTGSTQEYSEI
jgi:dipeptidyl aminopeptidase/acylaminoacyl peptidase